jgi:penicillin-binding protein-related factor A (putative recombinase)
MTRETFATFFEREFADYRVPMPLEHAGTIQGQRGLNLEQEIQFTNRRYEAMQLGLVMKNHVLTRFARGEFHHVSKQTVDFSGFLKGIGHVAFDAKVTDDDCFIVAKKQVHQLCFLLSGQRLMANIGARFFYIVRWQQTRKTYLVEDLEALAKTGKYEFDSKDVLPQSSIGAPVDYRAKLIGKVL